jgi:uncharacterized protein (DUF433 family)
MVEQVLEQVTAGMAWEAIAEEWRDSISKEAIAKAVRLIGKPYIRLLNDASPHRC